MPSQDEMNQDLLAMIAKLNRQNNELHLETAARFSALFEVLEFTEDQLLDFINAVKRKREEKS